MGSSRRPLHRLGRELRALAIATAYFGLCFLAALTILDLLLEDYDVDPPGLSRALIFAFITSKVVVAFERLPLAHLPGLVEVVVRSTLYTLATFWLLVLEKAVDTRAEAGGLAPAFRGVFTHPDMPAIWALAIGFALAFAGFTGFAVIRREIGADRLRVIFLHRPAAP